MQNIKIKFTEKCLEDIEEACQYIEEKLKAENAPNKIRIKIKNSVKGLSTLPEMYAKTEKLDRVKRVYRRIPIDNYVFIDKESKIIYISHMYNCGRNYLEGLIWNRCRKLLKKDGIKF